MRLTPALALALAAGFAVPVAGQAATPATVNTGVPTITGPAPPHPGDTLTCNPGTWIDAQSFSYTWTRDGVDLSRPSSAMYTVSDADLGTSLGCSVMGIGFSGSATGHSTATAKVTRGAPVNTAAPALSAPSPARAGDAISCSQGTWNGAAGYTYAWTRDGVAIAGQSAATYTATTADAGHAITCTVTATSPHGSTTLTATAVSVSALPDTTALLAKASGTGWKTAGTADKLGVYTLPLTPVDGWAVNCESLTPGGKAIDTIVGKIGCTKDAITLVPLYPTKGENTWKGELTLTHGAASIKASINLTTTADQIPPADAAPPPLDAPKLNADGTITCPTGSSVTNLSTGTITQKQPATFWDKFVLHFTGPGNGNYTPPTDDPNQQLAKRGP